MTNNLKTHFQKFNDQKSNRNLFVFSPLPVLFLTPLLTHIIQFDNVRISHSVKNMKYLILFLIEFFKTIILVIRL